MIIQLIIILNFEYSQTKGSSMHVALIEDSYIEQDMTSIKIRIL